jgi:hypothetical protein
LSTSLSRNVVVVIVVVIVVIFVIGVVIKPDANSGGAMVRKVRIVNRLLLFWQQMQPEFAALS